MKIVIDIPEARYKDIQRIASVQLENPHFKTAEQIIANGTQQPEKRTETHTCDCISRQEVLDEINRIGSGAFTEYAYYSNLFDFVCELPSVEPKKCGDCVSRQDVLDLAEHGKLVSNGNYKSVCDAINGLPSVEPGRNPGKWEWNQRTGEYECSECGCNPIYEGMTPDVDEIDKYRFCRWCGAKMEDQDGSGGDMHDV